LICRNDSLRGQGICQDNHALVLSTKQEQPKDKRHNKNPKRKNQLAVMINTQTRPKNKPEKAYDNPNSSVTGARMSVHTTIV